MLPWDRVQPYLGQGSSHMMKRDPTACFGASHVTERDPIAGHGASLFCFKTLVSIKVCLILRL